MKTATFWLRALLKDQTSFKILKFRSSLIVFSFLLMALSMILLFFKPLNLGIDFKGGFMFEIRFSNNINISDVRKDLARLGYKDAILQNIGSKQNEMLIKISSDKNTDSQKSVEIFKNIILDNIDKTAEIRKSEFVGSEVGVQTIKKAALSFLLTLIGIMAYIWYRFNLSYAIGVIVGLIHDLILTIGFLVLTQIEFNSSSIAALLTVLGYSVNDTVVIYDRVRENMKKMFGTSLEKILDTSINETIWRTTFTVLTTLVAVAAVMIFAGESLYSFSVTVFVGVLIGTYSSMFISVPYLWFFLSRKKKKMF